MTLIVHNKNFDTENPWYKLEIIDEGGAFYLLTYLVGMTGDSYHLTIEDAKKEALLVYGVNECDWIEVPDNSNVPTDVAQLQKLVVSLSQANAEMAAKLYRMASELQQIRCHFEEFFSKSFEKD